MEPEAPFVIEHREELIYVLCLAAELEHGFMCQYLFAAFSLKQRADEETSPLANGREAFESGRRSNRRAGNILITSLGVIETLL